MRATVISPLAAWHQAISDYCDHARACCLCGPADRAVCQEGRRLSDAEQTAWRFYRADSWSVAS